MVGGTCIVVDVPCFTTAVEAAVTRSVTVYPFRWRDARTTEFANSVHAVLAQRGRPSGPTLSPVSMDTLAP
jgi:2-phosphosulfolactate phosphatase